VTIAIYGGWLLFGYSTIYTGLPVLSLIVDEDLPVEAAVSFPPLYQSLQKGRLLSMKTFFIWIFVSIY